MLSFGLALSLHLLPGEWNSAHPFVELQHEGWSIGLTKNSEGNASVLAGYEFTRNDWWLEVGAATGYKNGTLPWLRAGYGPFFIAPAVDETNNVGLVLGVELKIGGHHGNR